MNEQLREVKEYTQKIEYFCLIGGSVFCLLGIFSLFVAPICILIFGGLGAAILWAGISPMSNLNRQMSELENDPMCYALLEDFNNGQKYLDDGIRAGKYFVIGKKTNGICKISDITKVYQYVHRTNGIEDRRELRVEAGGKTLTIAILKAKRIFAKAAPQDEEMKIVIIHLLTINPNIKIGYR